MAVKFNFTSHYDYETRLQRSSAIFSDRIRSREWLGRLGRSNRVSQSKELGMDRNAMLCDKEKSWGSAPVAQWKCEDSCLLHYRNLSYPQEVSLLQWHMTRSREDSEIQRQGMARDEQKSQKSPWTTVPVTQAFDSTAAAIQSFLFDSSARRRRIWRRALCAQSTSPGSQLQRRYKGARHKDMTI